MSHENDEKLVKKKAYAYEYARRDYVMESHRARSLAIGHHKKVLTTKKRLEELTMDDLLYIAYLKCMEAHIDFGANMAEIERVLRILHGPETIKAGVDIVYIKDPISAQQSQPTPTATSDQQWNVK